jgi:hypothetical protein
MPYFAQKSRQPAWRNFLMSHANATGLTWHSDRQRGAPGTPFISHANRTDITLKGQILKISFREIHFSNFVLKELKYKILRRTATHE